MARRTDDSLRSLAGYRLQRANLQMQNAVKRALRPLGLRRTTFSALHMISGNPGMRQAELAAALAIERPNLVKIIAELEATGLVERAPSCGDKRAYELTATPRGKRLQKEAFDALLNAEAAMVRGLSEPELEALAEALERIETNAQD